ncbi:response regulator [Nocardioides coralli]|uniref:response regulator n=1 Tax=Nocardioides coralli TaxID=2872154 RepID=UPI001CA468C3|nr:response regulator [Nocardioides coralli]QZY30305.1 response regulator [Nocardioides coralli]
MSPHRVVVADDDDDVRAALAFALDRDRRFEVVARLADAHDLLAVVRGSRADVVLLDVRMPGGGASVCSAVRDHSAAVVVVVSAETSAAVVEEYLTAGARGYLGKGRLGDALPDLVSRCLDGEVILAVPTAAVVLRRLAREP